MTQDSTSKRPNRGLAAGLILVGTVLLLALAVLAVRPFLPRLQQLIGRQPTPTVALPSPTPTVAAGSETPPQTPSPTPLPTVATGNEVAQQIEDLLSQAEAVTLRSKLDEATSIYDYLIQMAPDDARPQAGKAWMLIYDAQPSAALPYAQRAVELDPSSGEAATVLSRAYADTGDRAQALSAAQQAVELDAGSAEAHAVLADAYRLNGQDQEAVREADLALVQDTNSANAHRARGLLYQVVEKDTGQAASELQVAAGLDPELWTRRHELGILLAQDENYGAAVDAFQDALALRPKAETYTAIGGVYFHLEQYELAIAALQESINEGLQDAQTYGTLAAALAHSGDCDQAKAYAAQALSIDPAQSLAVEAGSTCKSAIATATAQSARATPKPTGPSGSLSGWIAFPVWNLETGNYDTYMAQAQAGNGRRLVVAQMHQPALSPDGVWLAVNGELPDHLNLHLVKPDGSNLMEITPYHEDGQPAWSPDGKLLALASYRDGGDRQSRLFVLDGIPFGGGKVEGRSLSYGPDAVRGEMPAWTADGQIVFRGCDLSSPRFECNGLGLYLMSAAPGAQTPKQLTKEPSDSRPAVAGGKVAFMSGRDGNWEIYLMGIDGSGVKRLTTHTANDGLPAWSPDGRTLAFVSDQSGAWAVWAMNPDGSNRRKLFDIGGGGLGPTWQQEQISWGP